MRFSFVFCWYYQLSIYSRNRSNWNTTCFVFPCVTTFRSLHAASTRTPRAFSVRITEYASVNSPWQSTAPGWYCITFCTSSSRRFRIYASSSPAGTAGNGTSTMAPYCSAACLCAASQLLDGWFERFTNFVSTYLPPCASIIAFNLHPSNSLNLSAHSHPDYLSARSLQTRCNIPSASATDLL